LACTIFSGDAGSFRVGDASTRMEDFTGFNTKHAHKMGTVDEDSNQF